MWNVETNETMTPPVFASRQEMEQLLRPPPVRQQNSERKNPVLSLQILICGLILLCIVCIRSVSPQLYESFQDGYRQLRYQGIALSGEEELVKFASAAIHDLSVQAVETIGQLSGENALTLGYGAGGWSRRAAPEGSSLEALEPENALSLPVRGYVITSGYGWRSDPFTGKADFHTGIDLAVAEGTAIHPAWSGMVQKSAWNPSYGNYVQILHENGLVTRYCHMQYIFVRQGQRVSLDDVLGTVGQTGAATGPHLHFELFCNDLRYDPTEALEAGT